MAAKQQKRFKVEVTDEDIAKAKRNNSYKCVVAQAIARTVPDATRIEVDTQAIRFTRAESGERYLYLTPPAVIGYVVAFDAGEDVEPFRFWIDAPMQIARRVRTEAGRAAQKARVNAERQVKKASPPKDVARSAERATESEPVSEEAKAEVIKQAYEAAKAEHPGEKLEKSDGGGRLSNPRVYKTGKRVYGSRILRVNRYLRETIEAG